MKLKVVVAAAVLLLVGLLVNAVVVDRSEHAAEPFGGGHVLDLPGVDLNVREYGPATPRRSSGGNRWPGSWPRRDVG